MGGEAVGNGDEISLEGFYCRLSPLVFPPFRVPSCPKTEIVRTKTIGNTGMRGPSERHDG